MRTQSISRMELRTDIVVYSAKNRRVLVVLCQGGKDDSAEDATHFRRNLLARDLILDAPYFLLVFSTAFYLWKRETPPDALPDFQASAKPVMRAYLGRLANREAALRSESLNLVMISWLGSLAAGTSEPDAHSEAEQIIITSGLYDAMRRGEIRFDASP